MATQQELQARLDAIEAAMATGATRVSYDGKSVEYRSVGDMARVRDQLRAELGLSVASRRTVAGYNSGLYQ